MPNSMHSIDCGNRAERGTEALAGGEQQRPVFSTSHNWLSIAGGIVVAGGVYPLVITVIYLVIGVAVVFWRQVSGISDLPTVSEMIGVAFILGWCVTIGGVVGLVWAGVVCLLTLPLVHLFVLSLKLRIDTTWLAAFSGGLVGFVAVLPVMLPMMLRMPAIDILAEFSAVLAMLTLGPGVTTVLGQLGGAWGARYDERREAKRRRRESLIATGSWLTPPAEAHSESDRLHSGDRQAKFQFGIRHLLWVVVWLSLLLSVIRLSGIPFEFVLPLLVGWLLYQLATLYVGRRLVRRLEPR